MSDVTYCIVDDVQRFVKRKKFTDDSVVTIQDVNAWIDQVSALVDAELAGLGYSIPISFAAKQSRKLLGLLVSYEVASMAENAVYFSANKNESTHGEFLHKQYEDLLAKIKAIPRMLPDVARGVKDYISSTTEDMNEGEVNHGDEIFTKERIDDFVLNNKVYSPSEEVPGGPFVVNGRISNKI